MSSSTMSIRPLLRDISAYTFGDVLTKGIGFLTIIIYSYFLSQEEMGVYGYLMVILGFCTTFLILGFDNVYARFFFEQKSESGLQKLTSTLFWFLCLWFSSLMLIYFLIDDFLSALLFENQDHQKVLIWAILSLPLKLFSILSNQALRNQFKKRLFVFYNVSTALITIISAILLLQFSEYGLISIFLAILLGDIFVLPFRLKSISNLLKFRFDRIVLKNALQFGVPFLPVSIAYWVFSGADRFMLEKLTDLETVGRYTVAVTLSGVMSVVSGGIGNAWSPYAVKTYEKDKEEAKTLFRRFLKIMIVLTLALISLVCFFGKEIISVLLDDEYASIFYPFLILIIGVSFKLTTQVTAVGISLKKKTQYFTFITLFVALLNIGLNTIFIPLYSEIGAAVATLISYSVLTLLYSFVSQKLFKVAYDKTFIFISLIALIVVFFISFLNFQNRMILFTVGFLAILWNRELLINKIK